MFPACGFGTRTLSSPLHIKRCRPPEYGPSNPSSRSRRMRCRSEVLLGMGKCSAPVGIQAKSGNAFTIANFKHKPVLQDLFKFSPASFKRFGISPDAVQFLYLPEISFVAEDFVRSVLKLWLYKRGNHVAIIAHNMPRSKNIAPVRLWRAIAEVPIPPIPMKWTVFIVEKSTFIRLIS